MQEWNERLGLEVPSEEICAGETGENSDHDCRRHARVEQTLAAFSLVSLDDFCIRRHVFEELLHGPTAAPDIQRNQRLPCSRLELVPRSVEINFRNARFTACESGKYA